mgnify:CR=1 FL=1
MSTTGFAHDASGNQTATGPGNPTLAYDFENFLKTVGSTVSYQVDAQGRRVRKTVGGVVTEYFYFGSQVISEKQGASWTDYIFFFGGQRIAVNTGADLSTAKFLHADHLGSTRVCTDANGNATGGASMCRCGRAVFLSSRRMIQHEPWPLRELTGCRVRMSRSGSSPAERVRVLYPPTTASLGWNSAVHEHTTTCRKGSAGPAGRSPYRGPTKRGAAVVRRSRHRKSVRKVPPQEGLNILWASTGFKVSCVVVFC